MEWHVDSSDKFETSLVVSQQMLVILRRGTISRCWLFYTN
ncbi:hypothetical protein AC77_5659 [Escherichia coli 5-366-08_S4_C1]|nr:hypothetical protein AC77_5659 [Escherichia coli 5-366-08_S4_C1]